MAKLQSNTKSLINQAKMTKGFSVKNMIEQSSRAKNLENLALKIETKNVKEDNRN
jgi:hypothetical protein